jgi:hypothetical protein
MEPTIEQLAAELYTVAVSAAATHGRTFKQSSASGLKEITRAAAEEVLSPRKFGTRSAQEAATSVEVRMDHARAAVRALVDAMAAHASTVPGYDKDRLGERTLAHAMYASGFCPCWPIC